jgi:DNA-binding NtrC family response regulator
MPLIPKLLLIDDNEEILSSLRAFFAKKNYVVESATNGLDALKIIEAAADDFDLVITDLVMPNISGVAITAIIKKRNPKIPVIAITGYGEQPEALAREVHADVVMEKPFKLNMLEDHISKLLKKTCDYKKLV